MIGTDELNTVFDAFPRDQDPKLTRPYPALWHRESGEHVCRYGRGGCARDNRISVFEVRWLHDF